MTGHIQIWTATSLADLNLAAIAAAELEQISLGLWNKPCFRVVEEVVQDIPLPMKSTDDGSDPYELDWDLIYAGLAPSKARAHLLLLSCERDVFPADARPAPPRIGFNLHWLTKHVSGTEFTRVLRGLIRHEVGHWVITNLGRKCFSDPELNALLTSDWTVAQQSAFDARCRSLEEAEDTRLVYNDTGFHCLQPSCIMRQRGSIDASLGLAEIADCDYCWLCRGTIIEPPALPD